MTLYQTIHQALREKGMAALPEILKIEFEDQFGPVNLDEDDNHYTIIESAMPVFAAAHLGLSPRAIGTIMQALDLTLEDIDRGFDQGMLMAIPRVKSKYANEDPDVIDARRFDGIVYLQQAALAYTTVEKNADHADEAAQAWLKRPSTRMIACMGLGVPEFSCKLLLDAEAEQVTNGLDIELIDTAVHSLVDVCMNTSHPAHLPNRSLADFFDMTGAFTDHVTRKRMGGGDFWSQLIVLSMHNEMHTLMLDHVLSVHLQNNPVEVKQALMSYQSLEGSETYGPVVYEHIFRELSGTVLSDLLTEDAFIIEFITNELGDAVDQVELIDNVAFTLDDPKAQNALRNFLKEPSSLYQRIMLSHMHDSAIPASANHFMIWAKIKDVEFGPQKIDPQVATRYLAHMAKQIQTLRYPGYENTPELDECYDNLAMSMRSLARRLDHLVDYVHLKQLPESDRGDLVLWGFDMREMEITEGRVALKRLEIDLGL